MSTGHLTLTAAREQTAEQMAADRRACYWRSWFGASLRGDSQVTGTGTRDTLGAVTAGIALLINVGNAALTPPQLEDDPWESGYKKCLQGRGYEVTPTR